MSENNDFLNGFLDSNSGTSGGGFADLTLPDFDDGSQGTNPQKAEVDTASAPQVKVDVNHIESLHQLSGLPYYILSMPDNDDYFKTGNNRLKANHRDLLEHLKDKDRQYYYDNILVTMPSKTLKDFIDGG